MKIVVLVKHVPCAVGDLSFASHLTTDRVGRRAQLSDADEIAVDQALRIALRWPDVQITAVMVGPVGAVDALRRALVLGADEGIYVRDEGLSGCDALATSRVLAAVVDRLGFDLVLCGTASADSEMSPVPAMVAERLGVAALCFADALKVGENGVEIRRDDGVGLDMFAAALPAVVSVTERCGQPRYPRFVATVEARHKLVRSWSLADLDIDEADVGLRAATVVRAVTPHAGGRTCVVVKGDATSAAVRLADFLVDRQFLLPRRRAPHGEEGLVGPVLVLVERSGTHQTVCRSTYALLTIARRLGTPVAVLCGPADAATIALLGRFGAKTVCTVTFPEMDEYPAAARVETLVELAHRMSPTTILIASGRAGQEIAARVAVRLDSGIVTDAVDIRMGPDGPIAAQSVLAGSHLVESGVVRGVAVFTVRAEAVTLEAAPVDPTIHQVNMTFPDSVRAVRRVPRFSGRRPDLTTAAVVVAGGRGVGSRHSFDLVGLVADALGGAVGGSHTATELGWCPRDAKIDQTGRIINPRLYLALGISGSVRHRAGMQGARTIVAIDHDPAAPIFRMADLGVVGDLHQVVPELLAEIKRRKAQPVPPEV